jgi:hypothetical protein
MEGQSNLAAHLHTAANNVQVVDDTHSLFGELYTPGQVWSALWDAPNEDPNVGSPTTGNSNYNLLSSQELPRASFLNARNETVTPHEVAFEIHNTTTTNWTIRVRWIDSMGNNDSSSYLWSVAPSSTFEQYTTPGHLFVLSLVSSLDEDDDADELILGAYRPKRALPSGTPHCIFVHGGGGGGSNSNGNGNGNDNGNDDAMEKENLPFLLETLLLDESKFDALTVAASELDHHRDKSRHDRTTAQRTVLMLQTILKNALQHPNEEKYHKLRLSNPKIQQFIASSWGALEVLRICGFIHTTTTTTTTANTATVDDDDDDEGALETFLTLPTPVTDTANLVGERAIDLLGLLVTRLAPDFIPDIAPPTPWQETGVSSGSTGSSNNWNSHRGFITDEERWARAERAAGLRRSGASRRPAPGEAPSSRGKWGR